MLSFSASPQPIRESAAAASPGSKIMAKDADRCAGTSEDGSPDACKLSTLRKRSQLDFEIDFFERILSRDPNYVEVLMNLGDLFARKGCHRRALQVDLRLAQLRPQNPTIFYNLACSHAVLSHMTEALAALEQAVDLGYSDLEHLLADPDLASLRCHVGFRSILARLEAACAATRLV
jgi:tetratricopeptide (TPR) repeat protein